MLGYFKVAKLMLEQDLWKEQSWKTVLQNERFGFGEYSRGGGRGQAWSHTALGLKPSPALWTPFPPAWKDITLPAL